MSQSLAGTVWDVFNGRSKAEKKVRRKPGPEWEDPIMDSKFQLVATTIVMVAEGGSAVMGNIPSATNFLWNTYLFAKGVQNYRITLRSAEEAPLRELLGSQAPANDNVLTPNQSLSNSRTLVARSLAGTTLSHLGNAGVETLQGYQPVYSCLGMLMNGPLYLVWKRMAKSTGPTRMPSLTGKLPKPE